VSVVAVGPVAVDEANAGTSARTSAGTSSRIGIVATASLPRLDRRGVGVGSIRSRGSATRMDRTIVDLLAVGQAVVG
jgi:hypothetical protein